MDTNNTSTSDPSPERLDHSGLTKDMAAYFAAVAALPDAELKAHTKTVYENDRWLEILVYLRDNSPEKAVEQLGVSVEDMKKMSPEEMVAQAKQNAGQIPMEELRSQMVEAQQKFAATLQEKEAGGNEAGSSAG